MDVNSSNPYSGSSTVLLYNGTGVNGFCKEAMHKKATELLNDNYHRIEVVNSERDLRMKLFWERNPFAAIFVPGGHDPTIADGELGTDGLMSNLNVPEIINAIKKGTPYFGECAGGLIGSEKIYIRLGGEVVDAQNVPIGNKVAFDSSASAPRLGIIPVNAYAPLLDDSVKARKNNDFVKILDVNVRNRSLKVMHLMGPAFDPLNDKVEVISRYHLTPDIHTGTMIWDQTLHRIMSRFHQNGTINKDRLAETVAWKENETSGKAIFTGCHYTVDSKSVKWDSFKAILHQPMHQELELLSQKLQQDDIARDAELKALWSSQGLHVKRD